MHIKFTCELAKAPFTSVSRVTLDVVSCVCTQAEVAPVEVLELTGMTVHIGAAEKVPPTKFTTACPVELGTIEETKLLEPFP